MTSQDTDPTPDGLDDLDFDFELDWMAQLTALAGMPSPTAPPTEGEGGTAEFDLDDLDFYLELSEADWRELVENTKANGGADHRHTLNTLDLLKEDGLSQNATGDQLRGDIFFRVNQSLQHFFDLSAQLDTVFE